MTTFRYDSTPLAKGARTAQGFLKVPARIARVGVQTYRRADGSTRKELRHPDDVFAAAALATADVGTPVTIGHPTEFVTPENTKRFRVGALASKARADGAYVSAELLIDDASAIARADARELVELSAGYEIELDETPGVWQGERYDARQTNIRLNHVALLPAGGARGGRDLRLRLDSQDAILCDMKVIRIDGKDFEVSPEVGAHLESVSAKLAASEKSLGAAEAKVVEAQARIDATLDPKALDARVAERVALETAARKVMGPEFSASGKSAREVHEAAIKHVRGDAADLKRSDEYLAGQFEVLTSGTVKTPDLVAAELAKTPGARTDATEIEDPSKVYAENLARKAGKKVSK